MTFQTKFGHFTSTHFPHMLKLSFKGRSQFAIHCLQIGGELTEIGFLRRNGLYHIFINSPHSFSQINTQSKNTSTSTITFFYIFTGPMGCLTLTMTQIPMAHKYDKLLKGATLSDVYSFGPLKLHCTRINGAFPTSIISPHEVMYSLRSCYIVSSGK